MGVKGLWTLLEPVGRRIPAEALGGKRLAVDASIWLVQFLKAMRDERGEPLPHAHLLGFFRRVCKLLFLGVRPVFVFDGSTPELKRQTTAARRRGARNAGAQARRAAEKLLLVQMRRHALAAGAGAGAGAGTGMTRARARARAPARAPGLRLGGRAPRRRRGPPRTSRSGRSCASACRPSGPSSATP